MMTNDVTPLTDEELDVWGNNFGGLSVSLRRALARIAADRGQIEQYNARAVEHCKVRDALYETVEQCRIRIARLTAENERLREALKYYDGRPLRWDGGKRARAALATEKPR